MHVMTSFSPAGLKARSIALDHAEAQVRALNNSVAGRAECLNELSAARQYLDMGSVRQAHMALRSAGQLLKSESIETAALDRLIEAAHRQN